jgi:transcription initiation factor IIE alpha subunit
MKEEFTKEQIKYMIEKLIEELKKDKSEGSYYYSWQANIAVAMQDAFHRAEDKTDIHKISNEGAKAFLDLLIG